MGRLSVAGIAIVLAIMLSGCVESRNIVTGTVVDVRITASIARIIKDGGDDAVGGAIVGGLIAGPVGAVLGAAAGSEDGKVLVVNELLGCKLVVKVDDRVVAYTFGKYGDVEKCSLERTGDKVSIHRVVWSDRTIEYWRDAKLGEILPE